MSKSRSSRTRSNRKPAAPARKAAVLRKAQVTAKPVPVKPVPIKPAPAKPSRVKASAKASPAKGKWVYSFGNGKAEGRTEMRDLLGGKGAGLAEMANLGLPVPPGFTITTAVCTHYYDNDKTYPEKLRAEVDTALAEVGRITGKSFGDGTNPLLVSVRSGARASMPGMMDTVLNLGLNDATVEALAQRSKNERFAWDCYRRFLTIFGDVVQGIDRHAFDRLLDQVKAATGAKTDAEVSADALKGLVADYKRLVETETGRPFPQDPMEQLRLAINAVFDSWSAKKAVDYRRVHRLPDEWGTAATVIAMVFGNQG